MEIPTISNRVARHYSGTTVPSTSLSVNQAVLVYSGSLLSVFSLFSPKIPFS